MDECLIRNVHVVDAARGRVGAPQDLVIRDGVIAAPDDAPAARPQGRVIDARGAFAIPALWDAHSHPGTGGPRDLRADANARITRIEGSLRDAAAAGVIGVRILGEALAADVYVRDRSRAGTGAASQQVLVAGPALKPVGGHGAVTIDPRMPRGSTLTDQWGSLEAHDEASLVRAVDLLVTDLRVDWVKIFVSGGIAGEDEAHADTHMTEEQIRIVCEAAGGHGVPVAAHAGNPDAITRAVRGGVRSIEHGYELSAGNAAEMAQNGVWYVPTISITHNESRMRRMGWSDPTIEKARRMQGLHRRSLEHARAHGVRIASGSDMRPLAEAALEEVLMLERVGFSAAQALELATSAAAEMCGAGGHSGSLEPGKRADVVLLGRNPLEHLDTILSPTRVIHAGRPV